MAVTPEGKVKDAIKKFLQKWGLCPSSKAANAEATQTGWYHMPVPIGMGVQGIPDFYGHYFGSFFVIEAKIIGKDPTALQQHQLDAVSVTGAKSFVVRCEADLAEIEAWFSSIDAYRPL